RTGVRSRPLSSALALCRPTPANIAISSAAVKLRINSLKQTIPFLYHKRGNKNNYAWQAVHILGIRDCSCGHGAHWPIEAKSRLHSQCLHSQCEACGRLVGNAEVCA